jgi:hypothetical protein
MQAPDDQALVVALVTLVRWADRTVLAAAWGYERAAGWWRHRPPVAAASTPAAPPPRPHDTVQAATDRAPARP